MNIVPFDRSISVGHIKVSLVEYHNFKNFMEILKEFHDNVTFRFHPKGFTFTESNEKNAAVIHCDISSRWLAEYDYKIYDGNGRLLPEYFFTVDTGDFSRNAKQEGKKSTLTFYVSAPEDGKLANITIERDLTCAGSILGGVSLISASRVVTQSKQVKDYFVDYYRDRGPRAKMLMVNFQRIISSAKVSRCTEVVFCLTITGTVLLKCLAHERVIHQFNLHSEEDDMLSEETNMISFSGINGPVTLQIEEYKIPLRTNNAHQWVTKFSKLGGKIIEVYLDNDYPLMLVSLFGDGIGEFRSTFGLQPNSQ